MTSMEQVLAALEGRAQGRPPFTLTLSLYGARLIDCPLTAYYRRPELYVAGQEAVLALCAPDILFSPFALTLEAEAFGSELTFLPTNPPNIKKPAVRTADAFIDLPPPDIDNHPSLLFLRESIRLLATKCGGATPICAILTAPVDLPAIIMGIDMWIETLLFAPDKGAAILDKTHRHFVALANALLADGANFIGLTTVCSNPRILFPQLIATVILPALDRAFRQVKGPVVFHHGRNPMLPNLDDYLTLANVAAFAVDHRDSLAEARKILGPNRLLLGNLHGLTLPRLSAEQVLARVDHILDDRKNDPCFIFSTTAADVPIDTPPDLLQAIAGKIRTFTPPL